MSVLAEVMSEPCRFTLTSCRKPCRKPVGSRTFGASDNTPTSPSVGGCRRRRPSTSDIPTFPRRGLSCRNVGTDDEPRCFHCGSRWLERGRCLDCGQTT